MDSSARSDANDKNELSVSPPVTVLSAGKCSHLTVIVGNRLLTGVEEKLSSPFVNRLVKRVWPESYLSNSNFSFRLTLRDTLGDRKRSLFDTRNVSRERKNRGKDGRLPPPRFVEGPLLWAGRRSSASSDPPSLCPAFSPRVQTTQHTRVIRATGNWGSDGRSIALGSPEGSPASSQASVDPRFSASISSIRTPSYPAPPCVS